MLQRLSRATNLAASLAGTAAMVFGEATGLSVVHVNRVLQDLRAENLFTWQGHNIHILDWPALQQRAEFDARYLHLENLPR